MPTYVYQCSFDDCGKQFEIYHSIKSDYITKCPSCLEESLKVVIQAAQIVINEPRTVGMLADRNTAAMSTSKRSELYEKTKKDKILAKKIMNEELQQRLPKGINLINQGNEDIEPVDLKLASLTPAQTKKYIEEGIKP